MEVRSDWKVGAVPSEGSRGERRLGMGSGAWGVSKWGGGGGGGDSGGREELQGRQWRALREVGEPGQTSREGHVGRRECLPVGAIFWRLMVL